MYYMGTFTSALLDGDEPLAALAGILVKDDDVVKGGKGSLMADALHCADESDSSRCTNFTSGQKLHVSALLHRLSLMAAILPEGEDKMRQWPISLNSEELFVKALAVNVNGWLDELGINFDQDAGEPSLIVTMYEFKETLDSTLRDLEDLRKELDPTFANVGISDSATLARYAFVIDRTLEIWEMWLNLDLFDDLLKESNLESVKRNIEVLRAMSQKLIRRDYASAAVDVYRLANELEFVGKNNTKWEEVTRYASFTTALAQAEDGEQVAQVIGNYAAPVGSYRAKRIGEGGRYFMLNAYLGGGIDFFEDEIGSRGDSQRKALGVRVPVGFEYGGAIGEGWSMGVLFQVLDLGIPTSYRLIKSMDTLESQPEVGVRQLFSPGGYLVLGVSGLPLTLGVGTALALELRTPEGGGTEKDIHRGLSFFVGVDIPLWQLN
jgi:hypothetical protein